MKKVKFNIQGMTCSSCSAHVEKAVNKLQGVKKVNVNLLSNFMIVEYEENKIKNEQIIEAVIKAGYGASLYNEPKETAKKTEDSENTIDKMKKQFIISFVFLIPLMYIAMYHMFNKWLGIPVPSLIRNLFDGTENALIFAQTQLLLLIPILYINRNYFIVGFKRLFKGSPNMDSLIALGSSAATIYGIFALYMIGYGLGHNQINIVKRYYMDIYFESAGTILTLITFGKYLEAKSKGKTSDSIKKLINLAPKTAIVIRENKEEQIEIEQIMVGDIILIKPGNSIPVDGIVIEGTSLVDESSITGEGIPVEKNVNDKLVSGTINKNGYLKMKTTKVGKDTTLAQIIKLVEEASNSKAPIAKLADKVSGVFVPFVIVIAILATIFWLIQGQSFEFALSIGIAVLVISCPCALGLATPVAIMVGTGKGSEKGILIKSADSLELLHSIDTVVLDKTGTITEGKPKVKEIFSNISETKLLEIAGALEKKSEHPLAEAILEEATKKQIKIKDIENFEAISGRGVKGIIDGTIYYGGNISFIKENNIKENDIIEKAKEWQNNGNTILYFATEKEIIGIIAVADTIKKESRQAIQELKKKNIEIAMLTGDNQIVADAIGNELGIDNIYAELLPQDKESKITSLQKQGKKVAFVGDGINDSPAITKADVGIAIGSGTDIAIESADIVLIKNSLLDVVTAIKLSKAVINNIKMNLFWAFFYNIICIPIAAGAFYLSFGFKLNPMFGAAAMSLSSVCVVTNALRLKNFKVNYEEEKNMMKSKEILIEGMQCNHCKMTVENALSSIEGVEKVKVILEDKIAIIESNKDIENTKIKEKIEDVGFNVKNIKEL